MKLVSMTLSNFRGYGELTTIDFNDMTTLVGQNDIGKSTVLDALDVFFNDKAAITKMEKSDINKTQSAQGNNEIRISACFEDLPVSIVIDATNTTTFETEYMLNEHQQLEIVKYYPFAGAAKVYLRALHPNNEACKDLLSKRITDLQKMVRDEGIEVEDHTRSAVLRSAIWRHYEDDLQLAVQEIDLSKGDDAKSIWKKIDSMLPMYTLFRSDRSNKEEDSEVQDPLRTAVKQLMSDPEIQETLDEIARNVAEKLSEVSQRTLSKLSEINPELARTLNPVIPTAENLKWSDVFKSVSISGDNDIPINKRGSGVRRMVLLSFFRAAAEQRMTTNPNRSIIYAIEEPETAQHAEHQQLMIKALNDLANQNNTQVLLTTHSSWVVKSLDFSVLRIIAKNNGHIEVTHPQLYCLPWLSHNEINYVVFNELNDDYHNELYGYIEEQRWLGDYENGKPVETYIRKRVNPDGTVRQIPERHTKTYIIRQQIHHPENHFNPRFTSADLKISIDAMRAFIVQKQCAQTGTP